MRREKEEVVMSDNRRELNFEWIENPDKVGEMLFTFDGETVFNLFRDYPYKLTPEQKKMFDDLNPYWAEFFKDR